MPPLPTGKYPVIKLALEESGDNGPFRRIVFTKTDSSDTLLASLKKRAIELSAGSGSGSVVLRMQQYDVQLTYKDSDGDSCVLLSNADVLDALSQFADANSIKIWCKVSNKKRHQLKQSVSAPVVTTATQTTTAPTATATGTTVTSKTSYQGGAPVPFHQLVESIVGVLATALVALQTHLGQSGMLVEPKHTNLATPVATKAVKKDDSAEAKTKTDAVSVSASAPCASFSRAVPFTDVHIMGSPCVAPAAEDDKPKAVVEKQKEATAPVEQQQQPEEVESRPFIHGRHTCDVCLTTPIIGGRFHATNLPDYDLCQACHSNYKGKEITFEQVQLDRDTPFQDRWHRRYNKWGTTGRPHYRKHGRGGGGVCGGPPGGRRGGSRYSRPYSYGPGAVPFNSQPTPRPAAAPTPPAPSAPPAPEAKPEEVDQALKEAIRRSMADLMAAPKPAPDATTSATSKPVTRSSTSASTKSTKSVEQSVEEVADKVAKKMDQVALKVAESTKKVAEHVASEEFAESLDEVVSKVTEKVKMVAEKVDEAVKQHQEAVNKQNKKEAMAAAEPPVEKVVVEAQKVKEAPAMMVVEAAAKPAPAVVEEEDSKPEAVNEDAKPAAVETPPPAIVEITEEEIVVPPSESVVTEAAIPATASFELDAAGNGQVAADLGATMDQIVTAIRAMENELDRSSDSKEEQEEAEDSDSESFVDAQDDVVDEEAAVQEEEEATATETHGATILSGEETQKDDDSQNSWMVVNDQVTSDEALARAAQVIGSALFNSDISRSASENISAMSHSQASHSNASSESSESSSSDSSASQVSSVDSVPTTLPSIASGAAAAPAIAQVLLDRWAIQLSQLHELGFYNDSVSVDILERLQAANVGSGEEEEEVTVTQVINELMREW